MKQIVVVLSLIFIFAVTYVAFDANSKKEKKEVQGTSSMEHSFNTMKDNKGSLGTTPDYSKVGGTKKDGITVPQYKPTTSGVDDYTVLDSSGGIKNPNLPGGEPLQKEAKVDSETKEEKTGKPLTTRQTYVMESGVPDKYKDLKSPFPSTIKTVKAGMILYNSRCKACHGLHGYGDGSVGAALNPKPSNLSEVVASNIATDGYLFWTVTEGGAPLGTAMISLKTSLEENNRWNIIHYLRAEIAKK